MIPSANRQERLVLALLFLGVLAARLCHSGIVWVEEAYPAAAAIQILNGKMLYRDVWFDKPPLIRVGLFAVGRAHGSAAQDRGRGVRFRVLPDASGASRAICGVRERAWRRRCCSDSS